MEPKFQVGEKVMFNSELYIVNAITTNGIGFFYDIDSLKDRTIKIKTVSEALIEQPY